MTKHALLLLSTTTLLALPAAANPASTYVEAAAGISRADVDCAGTSQCDRTSRFGRITIGHELVPGLAAELSLGRWGTLKAAGDVPGFGRVEARVQARGYGVGLATSMALSSDWALTARLGLASNRATVTGTAFGETTRSSERDSAPYGGVGLRYRVNDTVSAGLSVDSTRIAADGEKSTLTLAGAFLRVGF